MGLRKPPKNDAQIDMFMPVFGDISARDGIDMMEFPFFSLSKKKRFTPLIYANERRGIEIIVSGAQPHGLATIWDKDILIWAVSQVREALDRGEQPSKVISFHPYYVLKSIRRGTSKKDYERLEAAIIRLKNTNVHTTLRTDERTAKAGFSWIDNYTTAKENVSGEAAGLWTISLNDWVYKAACNSSFILTLDDDYFLLTGGRERRLYLIARKHGGYQKKGFIMPFKTLYKKMGAAEQFKYWARAVRKIVKANQLPGYHLKVWRGKDELEYISFTRRSSLSFDHPDYKPDYPKQTSKMLSGRYQ